MWLDSHVNPSFFQLKISFEKTTTKKKNHLISAEEEIPQPVYVGLQILTMEDLAVTKTGKHYSGSVIVFWSMVW